MDTTLQQGQQLYINGQNQGTVNYDTQTGQRLNTGQSTSLNSNGFNLSTVPLSPSSTNTSLNSSTLSSNGDLNIPPAPTNTASAGLQGYLENFLNQYQNQVKDQQNTVNTGLSALQQRASEILGVQGQRGDLNTQYDLGGKQQKVTDYTNQLQAEQRALKNQQDAIYKTPGITTDQANAQFSEIQRQSLSKQADLALLQSAANNDYSTAQSIIDNKIKVQLEPLQQQYDFQKYFYEQNKADLTNSETKQFTLMNKALDNQLQTQQENLKNIGDVSLEAAKNGAPANILQAISNSKDQNGAIQAAGSYLSNSLDNQYKKAQIAKIYNDINTAGANNTVATPVDYQSFLQGRTPQQLSSFQAIPESDKSSVAQLVSGGALLSDLVKSRGAQGTNDIKRLINEATAVDPTFTPNTNKVRFNFLQSWNDPNGKASITRNAINTALGHLADFKTNADALDNGSLQKLNSVKNILSNETGDPGVLQIRTDINALASEIATIYKGGQPTDSEIKNWASTLAANFSKGQFLGVSNEISKLLSSKITATRFQYKSTMGAEYGQSLIDPDKLQALISAGLDPNSFAKENVPGTWYGTPLNPGSTGKLSSGLTYTIVPSTTP